MLHEPIQQQLARLGMRGAADALARLPLNHDLIDTLATLLEAECLHRDFTCRQNIPDYYCT